MRRYAPVIVLVLLAPFVAEVLNGSTPLSRFGGLLVLIPFYGGAALLIRELTRARGRGWRAVLLLGAAYALVEEGLAIQSLFNPTLFDAAALGGRWLDVNWVWSEWAIGYHAVFSIALPILLTELAFPNRRAEAWLGRTGRLVAGGFFLLGAIAVGALFRLLIAPDFTAGWQLLGATVAAVAGLTVVALQGSERPQAATLRLAGQPSPTGAAGASGTGQTRTVRLYAPWLLGCMGLVGTAAWFGLFALPQAWKAGALVWLALAGEGLLAWLIGSLLGAWRRAAWWNDVHDLSLTFGALTALAAVGFFGVTRGQGADHLAQGLIGVATLVFLATALVRRARTLRA